MRLILGIDPGSRATGFALLRARRPAAFTANDFVVVEAGVLRPDPKLSFMERLGLLHIALFDLVSQHSPDVCVIERAFVDKNANTAIKLGELRGAFMAACVRCGVPVAELTPADVKRTIAGNGRADKEAISLALQTLLGFKRGSLPHDATDALALSLCHGLREGIKGLGGLGSASSPRPTRPRPAMTPAMTPARTNTILKSR